MIESKQFNSNKTDPDKLRNMKNEMKEFIQTQICQTGMLPVNCDWKQLKVILVILMKDSCVHMNEKYPDIKRSITFNFEDSLKDLVDLMMTFDKE